MFEREYLVEAVEVGSPYLDVDEEESARLHRILMSPDPIEQARLELIAEGLTDPEQQSAILQRLHMDLEDPKRVESLRERIAKGEI